MLAKQEIITHDEAVKIVEGLNDIGKSILDGEYTFDSSDEDIHMSIERTLTERIGDTAKKLHTARSRNDQVATDMRLYVKDASDELAEKVIVLQSALLELAVQNKSTIMPGYTHLQKAQPVLFAHHLAAYFWMLQRDFSRLIAAKNAADTLPLGSAALAGTTYDLDRYFVAEQIGFGSISPNSLDAVSDRDFVLDLIYAATLTMLHLSRLCEELVLWSSSEFGFITLSDEFTTGSSIMPQKRNPDFAELIRGKSGRVTGDLVSLLVTLKSLPLAYNKDMQEDKEPAFDAIDTLGDSLDIMAQMIATMQVNVGRMLEDTQSGFLDATDLADYLVSKGVAFRDAHFIVGALVLECERNEDGLDGGLGLQNLSLDKIRGAVIDSSIENSAEVAAAIDESLFKEIDIANIVAKRNTIGGTGFKVVEEQLELAAEALRLEKEHLEL
jgi:argininosuccinate lyase